MCFKAPWQLPCASQAENPTASVDPRTPRLWQGTGSSRFNSGQHHTIAWRGAASKALWTAALHVNPTSVTVLIMGSKAGIK